MKEKFYEKLLNIKTVGTEEGSNKSWHYNRYEPTPYSALEKLFANYQLKSSDRIVDFGCGKGRLNFYLNFLFNAFVVGVEIDESFYQDALENRKSYLEKTKKSKDKIEFHCCLAEEYEIDQFDNRFYFFNPFSVQVFMKIINKILLSVEISEREIEVVLYYPSEDYIYFLNNYTSFELKEEVKLPGLYEENQSERFLIYQIIGN